ncbi:S41 family peptidase [candidate division KSB1 bacterium]
MFGKSAKTLLVIATLALLALLRIGDIGQTSAADRDLIRQFRRATTLFTNVLRIVVSDYSVGVHRGRLVRWSADSLLRGLDPWSALVEPEDCRQAEVCSGAPLAAGMALSFQGRELKVVSAVRGTEASSLGIANRDRILSIDGAAIAYRSIYPLQRKLKDRFPVRLELVPAAQAETLTVILENPPQIPEIVSSSGLVAQEVGYVRIGWFGQSSSVELRRSVDSLASDGAESLILDLRGNPGGNLQQAVEIASLFLASGTEVGGLKGRKETRTITVDGAPAFPLLPLIVLIDGGTAGAAELLAAGLSRNGRASLVGSPTWGHGSVQTLLRSPGTAPLCLRLTTAYLLTPDGDSLEDTEDTEKPGGIKPDFNVQSQAEPIIVRRLMSRRLPGKYVREQHLKAQPKRAGSGQPSIRFDGFVLFLEGEGFPHGRGELETVRHRIERLLRSEYSDHFGEPTDRLGLRLEDDITLAKAVEILVRAMPAANKLPES